MGAGRQAASHLQPRVCGRIKASQAHLEELANGRSPKGG